MSEFEARVVFLLGVILYSLVRGYYWLLGRKTEVVARRHTFSGTLLVLAVGWGMILLPLGYLFEGWFVAWDYPFRSTNAWIGTFIYGLSTILLWMSHTALGVQWSPTLEIKKHHRLVTSGIYAYVRHPMYAAFWGYAVGQAFLLPNWVAGFSGIIGFGLLYFVRFRREERMMVEKFGDEYIRYSLRTGRLIPRICMIQSVEK